MVLVGGKSDSTSINEETSAIVHTVKDQIAQKAGVNSFSHFEPVSQRSQVVAGINRFVKIKTGENEFIHATIWSKIDSTHEVTKVETGKKLEDAL